MSEAIVQAEQGLSPERAAEVRSIFASNGVLAQGGRYQTRDVQIELAVEIARAMARQDVLVAEAGTGVGKTYAYLAPILTSPGRAIISTGSKHLQDQLFHRDLPRMRQALKSHHSLALLKGRANYICLHHLALVQQDGRLATRSAVADLRRVVRFAKTSLTGDRADLSDVPEHSAVWPAVTSSRDNCLGQSCGNYQDCFLMKARRAALEADIVVVNHHLFFADLALRDEGLAELLPSADTVVFDEAHQLAETATMFFSETFSTNQIKELSRDVQVAGLAHARGLIDWTARCAAMVKAAADLRLVFGEQGVRLPWRAAQQIEGFEQHSQALLQQLQELSNALSAHREAHEDLERCAERAQTLQRQLDLILKSALQPSWHEAPAPTDTAAADAPDSDVASVQWLECTAHTVQMHVTPLSVAPWFQKERVQGKPRAWVFVSATLTVGGDFSHFLNSLGLMESRALRFGSPYNYRQQALLVVPQGLPQPNESGHAQALFEATLPLLQVSQGGAFILCTSLRMVQWWAERLRLAMGQATPGSAAAGLNSAQESDDAWRLPPQIGPLLVQGEAPKDHLLASFRRSGDAILIGSASFWEGVDVVGHALRLVVIDRLPFTPPDDPVLAARVDQLRQRGEDPFANIQIPKAALQLQQGAGRLIRSEQDWGVLVIGDRRLADRAYGRQLWASLPPFARTQDVGRACLWLQTRMSQRQAALEAEVDAASE